MQKSFPSLAVPPLYQTKFLWSKTDVFLTHNWGPNQDNHKRVTVVNDALKSKGLLTWFDTEKMEGDVKKKMTQGIDNASCVVVFITQLYIDKVEGENAEDNCQLEFGDAATKKTATKMVPIVMESGVRNASAWEGEVCMVLGRMLYVDMCDDLTDAKIRELYDRILSVNNGVKLTDLFEKCMTLAIKHATLPSGTSSQQPVNLSAVSSNVSINVDLYEWLTQTVRITPKAAETYCAILTDANIGSVDRLTKRYQKNKNLLAELNIDEFDAEDMVKALVVSAPTAISPLSLKSIPNQLTDSVNQLLAHASAEARAKVEDCIDNPLIRETEQSKLHESRDSEPVASSVASVLSSELSSERIQSSVVVATAVVPSHWTEKASWDIGVFSKVTFSPDGSVLTMVPSNKTNQIFDPSGRLIATMKESVKGVTCFSFSPDGKKLAAGGKNANCVKLFEVSSGRVLWSTSVTETYDLCFFNSSTLVASEGYRSKSCVVIDVSSGSITSRISADGSMGLCVSSRGTLFIAGLSTVTIWDNLSSPRHTCSCPIGVCSVCINSDGSLIYVGFESGDIRVYSDSGRVIGEVKGAHDKTCGYSHVNSLSINANNSVLATGGRDHKVKLWNASTLECIQTLEGHTSFVMSVCFSPNHSLVSGDYNGNIKVWS